MPSQTGTASTATSDGLGNVAWSNPSNALAIFGVVALALGVVGLVIRSAVRGALPRRKDGER